MDRAGYASVTGHRQFDLRIMYTAGVQHLQDQANTVILDSYARHFGHSYFGHRHSGQLLRTKLFRTFILDTVILDSYFGHSNSGQLFWTQ
jgi:hypothetical protein